MKHSYVYMYMYSARGTTRRMGVKLISLLPSEHSKGEGTKGAGKLLPEVFSQFLNFVFLFH